MELHCASSSYRHSQRLLSQKTSRVAGLQAQASRREVVQSLVRASPSPQTMPPPPSTSTWTSSSSSSSSFLATAAAAVLLFSALFTPSAFAADFVAPGSIDLLQPPPSRAKGLARSAASAPTPPPPPPSTIELLLGSVRVSDGDTVEITSSDGIKHKVRIWGIDAPETKQLCRDGTGQEYECGKKATEKMRELLGETATCEVKARDQYNRAVARCFPGIRTEEEIISAADESGGDAGLALVESGDAVAYKQFSKGFYEPAERAARERKKGIWGGEFEQPEDWRRAQRIRTLQDVAARRGGAAAPPSAGSEGPLALAPKPTLPPQSRSPPSPASPFPSRDKDDGKKAGCAIKGNISSSGNAKRYHVPGTVSYDSVKIDESKGERYFCTEEEAAAAGWEKAKYGGRPPKEKDEGGASAAAAAAAPSTDAEAEAPLPTTAKQGAQK